MADLAQLEAALVKADAAGDTEGAKVLAGEVRKLRSSPAMFTPSGEKPQPSMLSPEGMAGQPLTRFALGAASPFIGAAQLGANMQDPIYRALGIPLQPGKIANENIAQLERMKQEGRKQQQDSEGFDIP